MVNKILSHGKKIFTAPQESIISAATIIMIMVIASRVLGLVRQRVLAYFFVPEELSLFFAAFRLPDLIFEVLVFGTFSSAFIPVFTKALKKGRGEAWDVAGRVVNIGLLLFMIFATLVGIFAKEIYGLVAPGYSQADIEQIANLARILFAAQGFFVVSYVLTGVLESLRRFLIPALAPIFYNIGIIFGTIFLAPKFGLAAPAIGVVIGAFCHLLIQLPFAIKLGFKFIPSIAANDEVKEIGKLSGPRIVDLSFEQVQKTTELFLASLISTASYTYFTFASTLQIFPVNLFGTSLAKAALPTLARNSDNPEKFRKVLFATLYQIVFLVTPIAVSFIVLRIPIIRLVFGTRIFDWEATVQTGMVLSAFGLGIVFQSIIAILERAFYALHDTKTPVSISLITISLMVIMDIVFVKGFSFPVWALAASFSISVILQSFFLFYLLNKKFNHFSVLKSIAPISKSLIAAVFSGSTMYLLLKLFDKSVWVKKLSFLGKIDGISFLSFQRFVLDTRYTGNVFILTALVFLVGLLVYFVSSIVLRSDEVFYFSGQLKRLVKGVIAPIPAKESEPIAPTPSDTNT